MQAWETCLGKALKTQRNVLCIAHPIMCVCLGLLRAVGAVQVRSRSAPPAVILFQPLLPWQIFLMVLAEAQEGMPNCANISQTSAYVAACIALDKAGHMAEPSFQGAPTGQPRGGGEGKGSAQFGEQSSPPFKGPVSFPVMSNASAPPFYLC